MGTTVGTSYTEENRFESISDFKHCIIWGGEVVFEWKERKYGVFKLQENLYIIAEANGENEKRCILPDEVLEYMVGGDRLRDVITKVKLIYRTI